MFLLFLSGVLIAEIDLIRTARHTAILPPVNVSAKISYQKCSYLQLATFFTVGLFLASSPVIEAPSTTGYRTLLPPPLTAPLLRRLPRLPRLPTAVHRRHPRHLVCHPLQPIIIHHKTLYKFRRATPWLHLVRPLPHRWECAQITTLCAHADHRFHDRRVRNDGAIRYAGRSGHDSEIRGGMADRHDGRVAGDCLDSRSVLERLLICPLCGLGGGLKEE
jgi:hypothetical protein